MDLKATHFILPVMHELYFELLIDIYRYQVQQLLGHIDYQQRIDTNSQRCPNFKFGKCHE